MKHVRRTQNFHLGISMIILAVSVADWLLKHQTAVPVLYVAPILLTSFIPGKRSLFTYSAICTLLSIIWYFFTEQHVSHTLNLFISLSGIWSACFFILHFKKSMVAESRNKERLNALFEYATEGIVITNSRGEIVMINPIAEKQFGYEKNELPGKRIEVLIPERLSERHVRHREKYAQNPYPRPMGKNMLLYARRKNNTEFPVEISLSNFTTSEGHFIIAFIIDISERRQAEERLQKEKDLAQMYLDIAPVIFLVLSQNEQVELINQYGCRILGFNENEIIGKNWFDNFVETGQRADSREQFKKLMDGSMSPNESVQYGISTRKGTNRLITWKSTIIRNEKGHAVATLHSGEDITEIQKQEALLVKANTELQQYSSALSQLNADLEQRVKERTEELATLINKLEKTNDELAVEVKERREAELLLQKKREELREALDKEKELSELKSRFVTMASHEFRTPLSTILSSASLIGKYNEPGHLSNRIKHIERIKSSVHNLTSILNDFLSLGKLEEGKIYCTPVEFDITDFVSEIVSELKELTKPGQKIIQSHKGTNSKVLLDKNLTRNICINLLSNAVKYSSENSPIEFLTTLNENELIITVKDFGMGIPEPEQQHIFERFFRANNAANIQGTGLGLNIVKKYVELMGGTVSFESVADKGTTFTVILPVS